MSDGALALRNPVTDQPNKVAQFQIEMGFHAGPVAARIRMDLAVRCQSQTAISPAALRFGQLDLSTCELYKRDLRTFGNSEERHSAESCYVRTDLPKPRSRARREPELSRDASLFSVLEASWDSWEQRHEEECRNAEQEATGQINLSSAPVRSAGHVHPFFLPPPAPLPSPPPPTPPWIVKFSAFYIDTYDRSVLIPRPRRLSQAGRAHATILLVIAVDVAAKKRHFRFENITRCVRR